MTRLLVTVHVYFVPASSAQIKTKHTHPAVLGATRYTSSSMLPSSMYHKDRTAQHIASSKHHTSIMYVRRLCCVLVILLSLIWLLPGALRSPPPANYTSTADQNMASPAHSTAEHKAISSTQTCSWHYQIASCTKLWASSFCTLHVFIVSSLRESRRRRQPPAGRSPCTPYSSQYQLPSTSY